MINPKASNGHRFILVAIDYFTKWVEAASFATLTKKQVLNFLQQNIICRYSLPQSVITDNARNLNNDMMCNVCTIQNLSPQMPYKIKMNGAVEAASKNNKKILQKITLIYNDWHEKLPFALCAYKTSIRISTGETPYSLVYRMEAVLPIEVEFPSLQVLMEAERGD